MSRPSQSNFAGLTPLGVAVIPTMAQARVLDQVLDLGRLDLDHLDLDLA